MSNKISPFAVIKEAVRMYRENLKVSLIYGVLPVVGLILLVAILVPIGVYFEPSRDLKIALGSTLIVLFLAGLVAYLVSFLNYGITLLRGAPSFMPENGPRRGLAFLGRSLLLYLVAFGAAVVMLLAFYLVAWLLFGAVPDGLNALVQVVLTLVLGILLYRLYLQLPAAVMGEDTSFKTAWRLSRGHTLRMFWSQFLLNLIVVAVEIVFFVIISLAEGAGPAVRITLVAGFSLVLLACAAVYLPVFFYTCAIWYEALRRRDAAVRGAAAGPEAFELSNNSEGQ